jgi:hypothetical protein
MPERCPRQANEFRVELFNALGRIRVTARVGCLDPRRCKFITILGSPHALFTEIIPEL